ncbi:MAG: GNAT family N-acetyltransferase [Proteobacteria bacterium]|nr:GNAT family N-acetyltransferase [Pseudomonadota bacterium]MBU1687588.1 GNAT family N-acetyltransferase [Pseudomonadota bacterium]
MTVTIRPANNDDALFLAKMMLASGRGHVSRSIWEHILGCTEQEALVFLQLLAITATPHLLHHSCYLIAEQDGKPAASLCGYDPKTMGFDAFKKAMPEVVPILGWSDSEHQVALSRADKILPSLPVYQDGAWLMDNGATQAEYRRQGVFGQLIEAICQLGRDRGYPKAQVNLFLGNEPAIHAYQKSGFVVLEEKPDEFFEKMICAPGMLSLVKDL